MKHVNASRKIRVLIVEDSAVVREFLKFIIQCDARLEVAAAVSSAEEALRILDDLAPDVISLDIRLPGMNGLEATRRIMTQRPTPIVVIAASVESGDLKIAMKALEAGALAVLEKPVGSTHKDYDTVASQICTQLAIMSRVRVVRQHVPRAHGPQVDAASCDGSFAMLGIASSTGGPAALVKLLGELGPRFPLPILLVQHMTPTFLASFSHWLQGAAGLPVVSVEGPVTPVAGRVYVSAVNRHLVVDGGMVRACSGDLVSGQCPSGTVLFASMARYLGSRALAVVLTGMGDDGAAGLLEIRRAGGYTIAESEATAVVYGMPKAAIAAGAICESLALFEIAPRVGSLTAVSQGARSGLVAAEAV